MKSTKILLSACLALLVSAPASAERSCDEVYDACHRQLIQHARCATDHAAALVADAAAIFELQHNLDTAVTTAAFGPDPASQSHLERVLAGVKRKADASLSRPGGAEQVLIGDLHRRHAERLTELLEAPRTCDSAALVRVERSCRAGVGEVQGLTQGGWPSHVATCTSKGTRRSQTTP